MVIAQLRAVARGFCVSLAAFFLTTSVAALGFRLSTGKSVPSLSYQSASPAYAQAVGGTLNSFSAAEIAAMAPGLRGALPILEGRSLEPVLYKLRESLAIPIAEFEQMPAGTRREIVVMAIEDSMRDAKLTAYDLAMQAHNTMYVSQNGLPSRELLQRIEHLQREFGGLLDLSASKHLRSSYQAARERAQELRRTRVTRMMAENADALKRNVNPKLLFTPQFSGDAKNFNNGDWERLGREFSKLRDVLRLDAPSRGNQGNIKFLGGPLAGVGEFKFGANRTHRIYFRYRQDDDEVALLHYASREDANNPKRVYAKVLRMMESGEDAAAVEPAPEILNLMAAITEEDLDALDSDLWDLPEGGELVGFADRAPEEGEPPPSPSIARPPPAEGLIERAQQFLSQ